MILMSAGWDRPTDSETLLSHHDMLLPFTIKVGQALWPDDAQSKRLIKKAGFVLYSWASHFTLTVPLFSWVIANLMLWVILQWTSIPPRGE